LTAVYIFDFHEDFSQFANDTYGIFIGVFRMQESGGSPDANEGLILYSDYFITPGILTLGFQQKHAPDLICSTN